jgi:hypothetical protein
MQDSIGFSFEYLVFFGCLAAVGLIVGIFWPTK